MPRSALRGAPAADLGMAQQRPHMAGPQRHGPCIKTRCLVAPARQPGQLARLRQDGGIVRLGGAQRRELLDGFLDPA
jgi:hypothetical protein